MEAKDLRNELLLQEHGLIFDKISHFDNYLLRTRHMSITLWGAAIALGVTGQIHPAMCILASAVVFPFWLIELRYRGLQERYVMRRQAIESFLNGRWRDLGLKERITDESDFPVPDTWCRWTPTLRNVDTATSVRTMLRRWSILVFYVPLWILPLGIWAVLLFLRNQPLVSWVT